MSDEALQEKLAGVLAGRPAIVFAVLYGSAATEDVFNDVDVAVWLDREAAPAEGDLLLGVRLERVLRAAVSHPVDVRILNDASLPFRYNVSKGVPLVVNDTEAYYTFVERAWDEYLDFKPIAMRYLKEMGEAIGGIQPGAGGRSWGSLLNRVCRYDIVRRESAKAASHHVCCGRRRIVTRSHTLSRTLYVPV